MQKKLKTNSAYTESTDLIFRALYHTDIFISRRSVGANSDGRMGGGGRQSRDTVPLTTGLVLILRRLWLAAARLMGANSDGRMGKDVGGGGEAAGNLVTLSL
jgi:hypothetical protein